jgi:hypothetical protein
MQSSCRSVRSALADVQASAAFISAHSSNVCAFAGAECLPVVQRSEPTRETTGAAP